MILNSVLYGNNPLKLMRLWSGNICFNQTYNERSIPSALKGVLAFKNFDAFWPKISL